MTQAEIQKRILHYISGTFADSRLTPLVREVRKTAPTIGKAQIMEGIWALIGQRLAYFDYSQPASANWELQITDKGRAVVSDEDIKEDIKPDDLASSISTMGYFDARHLAAEAVIELLVANMGKEQQAEIKEHIEVMKVLLKDNHNLSPAFKRGFDQCLKQLTGRLHSSQE